MISKLHNSSVRTFFIKLLTIRKHFKRVELFFSGWFFFNLKIIYYGVLFKG